MIDLVTALAFCVGAVAGYAVAVFKVKVDRAIRGWKRRT